MEAAARYILETFDRLGLTRLRSADFAATPGAAADAALAGLVGAGCLREVAGQYERTELGRLEIAGPLEITLLTRAGCHLCEEALRQIEPLMSRFGAQLRIVDVDTDRDLRERYANEIPVVFLGSREVARHRIDSQELQAELSRGMR